MSVKGRFTEPYQAIVNLGVERDGECLLFRHRVNRGGYSRIVRHDGDRLAHRVAYEKWFGPIESGMVVDHKCHNEAAHADLCPGGPCPHRACVNPAHLRVVTRGENCKSSPHTLSGGNGNPDVGGAAKNRAKSRCPQDHAYDEQNTYADKVGRRYCKICQQARGFARRSRLRKERESRG